jgi:cytochrome c
MAKACGRLASPLGRPHFAIRLTWVALTVPLIWLGVPTFALPVSAEDAFASCAMCHQIGAGAKNGVGPSLNGVYGERAGSRSGFVYSSAMSLAGQRGKTWNEETLDGYLTNPRAYLPGTRMAHSGIVDADDRKAVIDYIKQFAD